VVAFNRYFFGGSFTSPTSAVVTGAFETLASDMVPEAEPLDPADDEHIAQTTEIINALSPAPAPGVSCNAVCETAASDMQALAASLPPEDDLFGPLSKTSNVNRLLGGSDTAKQIVQAAGDTVIAAALVPVEVPAVVTIGVVATVAGVLVYTNVIGGPRYSEIEKIARDGEVPVCGIYPQYATACPVTAAKSIYYPEGFTISADGAQMPYDGYVYQYKTNDFIDYINVIATCPNYLGKLQHAPIQFGDSVIEGATTLCANMSTHAPNVIAIAPGSLYPTSPFTHEPTAPVTPGDVQMGEKPGWTGPGSPDAIKDRLRQTLQDEALKAWLAYEQDPRCNPNPTSDTVSAPAIQEGESGEHYASCLKNLGLDPIVRVKPIIDADTGNHPGGALSSSQDPGTQLNPDDPVTIVVNPGPTGGGADAQWLRDIEAGLITHNPELVATIPEFETEVVSEVALQCAKNVKLAEATAIQNSVDSTASKEDCGDEEHAGLPMFISGNTTPQATQNDINALERNPLWTRLNRRLAPGGFTRKERQWYKHPATPGCTTKPPAITDPSCDEFPYFATLQGQFGPLKTETPHTEYVELEQNLLQGSLLSKFYLDGGPGVHPWYGCDVYGHPRTDVAAVPASRFLALPNKTVPTIGICNKPSSTP
jgi:hypothetical protein